MTVHPVTFVQTNNNTYRLKYIDIYIYWLMSQENKSKCQCVLRDNRKENHFMLLFFSFLRNKKQAVTGPLLTFASSGQEHKWNSWPRVQPSSIYHPKGSQINVFGQTKPQF